MDSNQSSSFLQEQFLSKKTAQFSRLRCAADFLLHTQNRHRNHAKSHIYHLDMKPSDGLMDMPCLAGADGSSASLLLSVKLHSTPVPEKSSCLQACCSREQHP